MTEYETISALRVDMYDCKQAPYEILAPFKPNNIQNYAWIPQTLGDQIWVLYEFKTIKDRLEWERSLPLEISKYIDRKLISCALEYGWSIRDENGFVVGKYAHNQ